MPLEIRGAHFLIREAVSRAQSVERAYRAPLTERRQYAQDQCSAGQ